MVDEGAGAQAHRVAHDAAVHAVLLMDLLRMVQRIDATALQAQVEQAERELESSADPTSALQGRGAHSVLEDRLAFLRSVQIQAAAVAS